MGVMDSNEPSARRRILRSRASAKLVGALAAASLAIPAVASADTISDNPAGSGEALVLHRDGSKAVPFVADVSTPVVLHRDGSKAVPFVADVSAPRVVVAPDGFDWGDALIGAGAALAIVALSGSGLTLRRRRALGTAPSGG
jgi:hypothetical protein